MSVRPPEASQTSGSRALLRANAGLAIWALCFVALYALLSLGCLMPTAAHARVLGLPALSAMLVLVWLAHAAWLAWLIARAHRRWRAAAKGPADARFAAGLGLSLHAGALLAVLWTGFPVAVLPACS